MQSSHPQIGRDPGFILENCGGINELNFVSLINDFCVTKSTTLYKPQL